VVLETAVFMSNTCEIRLQNLDFDPDPLFHFEDRLAKSLSIVAYTRRNDRNWPVNTKRKTLRVRWS
jgi:hypothetical protein